MPLLRRQPFERTKPPIDLRPEEEVFHCKLTNEIFRDYEAFFERIILCNSLVWSCSVTGKSALTYQEALECEEKARKSLGAFPDCLRRPILCIASMTSRTRLNDMNEEVYSFAKDRYFIGELLEVVHRSQKRTAKVIKVIVAKDDLDVSGDDDDVIILDKPKHKFSDVVDLTMSDSSEASEGKLKPNSASSSKTSQKSPLKVQNLVSPENYNYMVQFIDRKETITVKFSQCNRKKGAYTRDKSKLFLKQHCEPGDGIWSVKPRFLSKFRIGANTFEEVYAGPRPTFLVSTVKKRPAGSVEKQKKIIKEGEMAKKARKQLEDLDAEADIQKRLQKKPLTPQQKAKLLDQLRLEKQKLKDQERIEKMKAAEEIKQQKKNERDAERVRKLEVQRLRAEYVREWNKPRDDLSCDDLKPLPEPTPVRMQIPEQVFGDALMLVEFFRTFESILDVSDVFPDGVTLRVIERLLKKDVNGPLFDIVKVLLTTIFELQEEENIEEEEMIKELKNLTDPVEKTADASLDQLIKTATRAAQIPYECHGMALCKMMLDPYTMTEIVRLHLLSSGARASVMNAKFRYQERGGYTSLDDAGLDLRRKDSALLIRLSETNLFDLSPVDKMKVLITLTNQITSYAAARDIVEDYADQLRMARADLRQLQIREIKYDKDDQQVKWRRRCEEKAKELERIQALAVQKQKEREEKLSGKTDGDSNKDKDQPAIAPAQEDGRSSSRIKAQTLVKEEEELQKKLDKACAKDADAVLSFSEQGLTPCQIRYLDDKRMECRAKKREEGRREQEELQAAILRLQPMVANYPLGRDRMFRRYWLFGGTHGFFVEDQEEHVPEDYIKPVRQNLTLNPHVVEHIPQHAVHNLHSLNQVMLSPDRGVTSVIGTTVGITPAKQIVHLSSPTSGGAPSSFTLVQTQPIGGAHSPIKIVQTSPPGVAASSSVKMVPAVQSPVRLVSPSRGTVKMVQSPLSPGSPSPVRIGQGAQPSPVRIGQGAQPSPVRLVQAVGSGVQSPSSGAPVTSIPYGSTVKLLPTIGGVAVGPPITGTVTSAPGMRLASAGPTSTIVNVKGSPTSDKENLANASHKLSPIKITSNGSPTKGQGTQSSAITNGSSVVSGSSSVISGTSPVKIITLSPTKTFNTTPKLLSPNSSRSLLNTPVPCPAVDQILSAKRVRWAFYATTDALDDLLLALNPRGFREKELRNVLTEQKEFIKKRIQHSDIRLLNSKGEIEEEEEAEVKQKAKMVALPQNYRKLKSQGIVKDDSVQEQMELTLREMLLDMEERVFFGSLGSIKVKDRSSWREAIEQGSYTAQIEPDWPGKIKDEKMDADCVTDEASQAVRDLCRGLLQVEQGVDRRYLNPPLGETEKERKARHKALMDAKKDERRSKGGRKDEDDCKDDGSSYSEPVRKESTLERWQESLMSSTSLCQIYLHMATLEGSVAWSKSALHARCRLCRRKGDAEQMLLCDMCDRGHHMYCLKPKVTKVPEGDWFCPECRPKDPHRTPRKTRRRYEEDMEVSDDQEDDDQDADGSHEASDGDGSEQEEKDENHNEQMEEDSGDESTEIVSDEEDESEPVAPKIKMRTTRKPAASKSRKSTPAQNSKQEQNRRGRGTPTASRRSSRGVNESMEESKKGRGRGHTDTTPTSRPQSRNSKRKSVDVNGCQDGEGVAFKSKRLSDGSKATTAAGTSSRGNEAYAKLKKLEDFVRKMIKMDDAWPFLKPVTKKEAPDYHEIIKTPMDFSKIRMKMNDHQYSEPGQVVSDVRLMFSNCERYNLPSADPAKAGIRLSKHFEKKIKEMNIQENGATGRRARKN